MKRARAVKRKTSLLSILLRIDLVICPLAIVEALLTSYNRDLSASSVLSSL